LHHVERTPTTQRSVASSPQRAEFQSDILIVDGWAFISGLLPIDLHDDRVPLPEYIEAQTLKIFANLDALLSPHGLSKTDIVSVRVSLTDLKGRYERMNRAYASYFAGGRLPARSCTGVSELPRGASVSMDFVVRTAAV
jgi:enamine deaminase RidA (YjgF/YER057c/UK114 family)